MATREARSKRQWIDAEGNEVETVDATIAGVRYIYLGGDPNGITLMFPKKADPIYKFSAGMGFLTKAGNVVNTAIHSKEPYDPDTALKEWFEDWTAGTFVDRSTTGGGAKTNKDALAQAVAEFMAANNLAKFKDGKPTDQASVRQQLEEDTKGVLVRKFKQVPEILEAYSRLAGTPKVVRTAADL